MRFPRVVSEEQSKPSRFPSRARRRSRRRGAARWFVCLLATTLLFASALSAPGERPANWQTTEFDDRPYVAFPDVAAAFAMTFSIERETGGEIGARSAEHSLVVRPDSRQALVNGVRHWLSFHTRANEEGVVHLSLVDVETVIVPTLDPPAVEGVRPVKTIVFDPGHGGHDRGARSPLGLEKDYALDTVNRARRILESRGHKVVQSRLSDFFAPLRDRPAMTANYEDPIFVSVHYNSAPWRPAASGLEIFSMPPPGAPSTGAEPNEKKDSTEFKGDDLAGPSSVLANTIHRTLLGQMEGYDRGVKRARFIVLREAEVPAVLVEGGFLSNPEEAKQVHSKAWREKFAKALADGIEAYIEFAGDGTLPESVRQLGREPTEDFVPED